MPILGEYFRQNRTASRVLISYAFATGHDVLFCTQQEGVEHCNRRKMNEKLGLKKIKENDEKLKLMRYTATNGEDNSGDQE